LVVQRNDYFKKPSRQLTEVCCNALSAICKAKEAVLECGPSVADVVAQRDSDFNPKLCRMVEFAVMLSRPSCCGWRWTPRFAVIDRDEDSWTLLNTMTFSRRNTDVATFLMNISKITLRFALGLHREGRYCWQSNAILDNH
jgi:hypothetical protein